MEEDPVRSLSAEMASKIPALYDMMMVVGCCWELLVYNDVYNDKII